MGFWISKWANFFVSKLALTSGKPMGSGWGNTPCSGYITTVLSRESRSSGPTSPPLTLSRRSPTNGAACCRQRTLIVKEVLWSWKFICCFPRKDRALNLSGDFWWWKSRNIPLLVRPSGESCRQITDTGLGPVSSIFSCLTKEDSSADSQHVTDRWQPHYCVLCGCQLMSCRLAKVEQTPCFPEVSQELESSSGYDSIL